MKKSGLILIAILVIGVVAGYFALGNKSETQSVSVIKVKSQRADASIYCNGVVEPKKIKEVLSETAVAIDKVCVE